MTITTKSALAAELAISKARVSQYVNAGMPVRSDGKLNREEALNWISRNQISQTVEDKGATRARSLAKRHIRTDRPSPSLDRELDIAQRLIGTSGLAVVKAALRAGCSMEVAYALDQIVVGELDGLATEILVGLGHEGFGAVTPLELAGRKFEPDYDALARDAGQVFDEAACERFADQTMSPPGLKQRPAREAVKIARKTGSTMNG